MSPGEQPHDVPQPGHYPAGFDVDVVLSDGATAHVRPIRSDDGERITDFHARQSPQSIYYRYFSPRPRLSERDVEHLVQVDYVDRMALIALRGDELIGVARYDRWRHRSEAEVAFFVDDANHGRGLATVLLEHLAVRAREVGLTGFTASVLPENRKMIGVFTQAGFQTATRFADGVIEVRLGLQPTPEAEAAIEGRARAAASEAVRRLLSPRSVALIGASREPGTIGHDVLHNLQRAGFNGPVWPVNPLAHHVGSVRAVGSILDIPEEVDLAIVAVPAASVAEVVEECGRKQVYGVVVLSAGFAETGPEGAALEAEVLRVARAWGVRLVGPNCLGTINTDPEVNLHATFAKVAPRRGRVSLLSESGMVGAAIIARARDLGIGISSFVALGNRADVSGNDLLQYWESDPHTDIVCMYIESFGNPRHFSRLARRLTRAKPVVAVKTEWLPTAPQAAGSDPIDDALLRQTGVIQVPTLTAMLETTRLLIDQPLPAGRRVAVVGNAGGSLAIAADAALDAGLVLAQPSPATRASLADLASHEPGEVALVDLGLAASGADLERAVRVLAGDPQVDSVLVLYAPSLGATAEEAHRALDAASIASPDVPVAGCFYGPRPDVGREGGVPVYDGVDAAARALGRVSAYSEWLAEPEGLPCELDDAEAADARAVVQTALDEGRDHLDQPTSLELLAAAGLPSLATRVVGDVEEAVEAAEDLGYPVVLKAAGRTPTAKTAAAGVAIDLEAEPAVRAAWARMAESMTDDLLPAVVQPMVAPGVDVSVTVTSHPQVGAVLSVSPGGAAAALDPATDHRVLPLTDLDAQRLVASSRLAPLLDDDGRRVLERVLVRIAALADHVPELASLVANPVIITGATAAVADASAGLRAVERDPLPPIRRV